MPFPFRLNGRELTAAAEALYERHRRPEDPAWRDVSDATRVTVFGDVVTVLLAVAFAGNGERE